MPKNLQMDVTKEQVQYRTEAKMAKLTAWTPSNQALHVCRYKGLQSQCLYSPSSLAGLMLCLVGHLVPCYMTSTKNSQGFPIAILKLFLLAEMLSGT